MNCSEKLYQAPSSASHALFNQENQILSHWEQLLFSTLHLGICGLLLPFVVTNLLFVYECLGLFKHAFDGQVCCTNLND